MVVFPLRSLRLCGFLKRITAETRRTQRKDKEKKEIRVKKKIVVFPLRSLRLYGFLKKK